MPLDLSGPPGFSYLQIREARRHVLQLLEQKLHPHSEDLDIAVRDIPDEPIPPEIVRYWRIAPRQPGRKQRQRRQQQRIDFMIRQHYELLLARLRAVEMANDVKDRAVKETAADFHLSERSVYRVLARTAPIYPDAK